jgi:hypothetical protein
MQTYAQPGDQGGIMAQAGGAFAAASAGGTRPTTRNALMTMLLPYGCFVGGVLISIIFGIIAGIAGSAIIGLLGSLVSLVAFLAGAFFFVMGTMKMVGEIKSVTNNQKIVWWHVLIPVYGVYWTVLLLPQEVANAKRTVGAAEPTRSPVLYFFLPLFALASDINDIAARTR